MNLENLEERLDHEIELIENDDSLTEEEKTKEITELYREARAYIEDEEE